MGRAVAVVSSKQYAAFFVGMYLGRRDAELIEARFTDDVFSRKRHVESAIRCHRDMMRCLREYRREQRMQVAA
jgi:hypothetical protein